MDIIVYGKDNCSNCDKIKSKLEEMGVSFNYIKDDEKIMAVALELKNNGKLLEVTAPLILKNGEQIMHKDIDKIL